MMQKPLFGNEMNLASLIFFSGKTNRQTYIQNDDEGDLNVVADI